MWHSVDTVHEYNFFVLSIGQIGTHGSTRWIFSNVLIWIAAVAANGCDCLSSQRHDLNYHKKCECENAQRKSITGASLISSTKTKSFWAFRIRGCDNVSAAVYELDWNADHVLTYSIYSKCIQIRNLFFLFSDNFVGLLRIARSTQFLHWNSSRFQFLLISIEIVVNTYKGKSEEKERINQFEIWIISARATWLITMWSYTITMCVNTLRPASVLISCTFVCVCPFHLSPSRFIVDK